MIRFRALGECAFDVGADRLGPEAELAFALLLVLVMADGRRLSRRQVVELLWPAVSEERARHNLRQTLYKLRQLGVPVDSEASHLRLPPQAVDASPVLHGPADDPPPEVLLRPDLPFGEFLAGYAPRFSTPFAAWVEEQRGIVHARLRRALLSLMADERRRGKWGLVETLARKCLLVDPLNEEATMALAEATALSGSKRAAIQLLDGYLREIGPDAGEMRLPAAMLRRRIAERLPAQASFSAAPDCFVGREESIAFLRERMQPVLAGRARAVLVHGEEGMGKSRLVTEFAKMAELDGVSVARVALQSRDVDRPLSAFVDVVPVLQSLPGSLGCSPESVEYLRRLTDHDPEVLEPSEATREAELLFASVRRAIFDLVDAVAEEAPLVLCVEDVHWLDERSWRVMRELAGRLAESPVLLLFTSRLPHATPRPPAQATPWLELHRLPPLDLPAALTLFTTVVGTSVPPAAFRDWAVHVASGNPFFVRALASHWVETGELRAPASLQALVAARVERLTGRPLRTLQACAVLGKQATLGRVEEVLQYPRHELIEATATLEDAGFLSTVGAAIPCRHDLIARAALDRLQDGVRRLLHRSAGEVLEREVRDARSAALLWDCAQQWKLAGERARALALVRSTATHMLEVGLPSEAAEAYERAIELCETDPERVEMLEGASQALVAAGLWHRVIDVTSMITSLAERTMDLDAPRIGAAQLLRIEARWRCAEPLDALLSETHAVLVSRRYAPRIRLRAGLLGIAMADNVCDDSAFHAHYEHARRLYAAPGAEPSVVDQVELIYHTCRGDLERAVSIAYDLAERFREAGQEYALARALRFAASPLRRAGRFADAEALLREALAISRRLNHDLSALNTIESIVQLKLDTQRVDEAEWWLDHADEVDVTIADPSTRLSLHCLRTRVLLRSGRTSDAVTQFSVVPEAHQNDVALRRKATVLAVATEIALASGHVAKLAESGHLSDLEATLMQTASWGSQDANMLALGGALLHRGDANRARAIITSYLKEQRRERYSPPAELERLAGY